MSLKNIYRIIIKIFGVILFYTTFIQFIGQIVNILDFGNDIYAKIVLVFTIVVLLTIFFAFIHKTDTIITLLRLDKNFSEDKIVISNFTDLNMIKIALLTMSLYFFMSYLPTFLYESAAFFASTTKSSSGISGLLGDFATSPTQFNSYLWVISLCNLILSYLLFSNFRSISNFLHKKVVEKSELIDENL